eukprot:scaffold12917_cov94-Isochrysis_galbana.AAC.1
MWPRPVDTYSTTPAGIAGLLRRPRSRNLCDGHKEELNYKQPPPRPRQPRTYSAAINTHTPFPPLPLFRWAMDLGLVRKPSAFVSTICDDRKEELSYAGMDISRVFSDGIGIGGVVSLLWFRRKLPEYACRFLEMVRGGRGEGSGLHKDQPGVHACTHTTPSAANPYPPFCLECPYKPL